MQNLPLKILSPKEKAYVDEEYFQKEFDLFTCKPQSKKFDDLLQD